MDLRLAQYLVDFDLRERWHAAERLQVQTTTPVSGRIAAAATAGVGHLLVRAGTRLESAACQQATVHGLTPLNPDPCHGCAN